MNITHIARTKIGASIHKTTFYRFGLYVVKLAGFVGNILPVCNIAAFKHYKGARLSYYTCSPWTLSLIKNVIHLGIDFSKEKEIFNKILSVLLFKLKKSNNYDVKYTIFNLFEILYKSLDRYLNPEDLNNYISKISDSDLNMIKHLLREKAIYADEIPPDNIFYEAQYLLDNYKKWDVKLTNNDISICYSYMDDDNSYVPVILYFAERNKKTDEIKLLIERCKLKLGKSFDIKYVKSLIDKICKSDDDMKYRYYNYFDIKYHFNEDSIDYMDSDNIISEKIVFKNRDFESLYTFLDPLKNCDVTLEFDNQFFLKEISKNIKYDGLEIVPKKTSNRYSNSNGYKWRWSTSALFAMYIVKPIENLIYMKAWKFKFNDDIELPIDYEMEWRWNKNINIIIK